MPFDSRFPKTILKLGAATRDTATGLRVTPTHVRFIHGGNVWYNVQPRGLSPETGLPLASYWTEEVRIVADAQKVPTPEYVPFNALGSPVTDDASGFEGMATALTLHINGCVHVSIQPAGRQKNGEAKLEQDFDIRRCSGACLPKLTEAKRKTSIRKRPSPAAMPSTRRW